MRPTANVQVAHAVGLALGTSNDGIDTHGHLTRCDVEEQPVVRVSGTFWAHSTADFFRLMFACYFGGGVYHNAGAVLYMFDS